MGACQVEVYTTELSSANLSPHILSLMEPTHKRTIRDHFTQATSMHQRVSAQNLETHLKYMKAIRLGLSDLAKLIQFSFLDQETSMVRTIENAILNLIEQAKRDLSNFYQVIAVVDRHYQLLVTPQVEQILEFAMVSYKYHARSYMLLERFRYLDQNNYRSSGQKLKGWYTSQLKGALGKASLYLDKHLTYLFDAGLEDDMQVFKEPSFKRDPVYLYYPESKRLECTREMKTNLKRIKKGKVFITKLRERQQFQAFRSNRTYVRFITKDILSNIGIIRKCLFGFGRILDDAKHRNTPNTAIRGLSFSSSLHSEEELEYFRELSQDFGNLLIEFADNNVNVFHLAVRLKTLHKKLKNTAESMFSVIKSRLLFPFDIALTEMERELEEKYTHALESMFRIISLDSSFKRYIDGVVAQAFIWRKPVPNLSRPDSINTKYSIREGQEVVGAGLEAFWNNLSGTFIMQPIYAKNRGLWDIFWT